jgi:RNA polymerase sigma-70 factor (ECF subfamily)
MTGNKKLTGYEDLNRRLNDEMQQLAEAIVSQKFTERDRNRLVRIMEPKLRYFIWKFFNNKDETEEVLHNTFFKVFKSLSSYNPKYRFTTWIYTIARNESLLHLHKLKQQMTTDIDAIGNSLFLVDDSRDRLEKEYSLETLYTATILAIEEMPESLEKSILIDKELNKMKGADIADKYEMNLNTVKTKIRKARKILKDSVLESNPELVEKIKDLF